MALTDLLRSLDDDAETELNDVLADQQQQADRILRQAEDDSADLVAEAVARARTRATAAGELARAEAAAQARGQVERAAGVALDELEGDVRGRLHALPGTPTGTAATLRLLREALTVLPGATWARVHPADVDAAGGVVPTLQIHGDLDGTGAVVGDEGGRSVDNTAATRLTNLWPEHRALAVRGWRNPQASGA